jgi:hypothetical protein
MEVCLFGEFALFLSPFTFLCKSRTIFFCTIRIFVLNLANHEIQLQICRNFAYKIFRDHPAINDNIDTKSREKLEQKSILISHEVVKIHIWRNSTTFHDRPTAEVWAESWY